MKVNDVQKDEIIIENIHKEYEQKLQQQKEEFAKIQEQQKNEFEEKFKKEIQKIHKNHEEQIEGMKAQMINQVHISKKTIESSFYMKERKIISLISKDLQLYIGILTSQLSQHSNDNITTFLNIFKENINSLLQDLNIICLDTQVNDVFDSTKHQISEIVYINDESKHDTIAHVIKQGFEYNNQIISCSLVDVFKHKV